EDVPAAEPAASADAAAADQRPARRARVGQRLRFVDFLADGFFAGAFFLAVDFFFAAAVFFAVDFFLAAFSAVCFFSARFLVVPAFLLVPFLAGAFFLAACFLARFRTLRTAFFAFPVASPITSPTRSAMRSTALSGLSFSPLPRSSPLPCSAVGTEITSIALIAQRDLPTSASNEARITRRRRSSRRAS